MSCPEQRASLHCNGEFGGITIISLIGPSRLGKVLRSWVAGDASGYAGVAELVRTITFSASERGVEAVIDPA